jgi:hypothetical protein
LIYLDNLPHNANKNNYSFVCSNYILASEKTNK